MDFQNLWTEKYRPKILKNILLTKEVREFVENIEKSEPKVIPHLLLHGPAGVGKTTIAKVLVNDVLKCEYLYINASEQNGVETVRGIITNFVQTRSFDGGIKIVILDEADSLTDVGGRGSSAQQALRGMMEEYSPYARFILTCNYPQKISEPIWSRVQAFYIQPDRKDFIGRCLSILKAENVTLTPEYKQQFLDLINDTYPDLRKCIGEMQKFSISGKFQPSTISNKEVEGIAKGCYDMLIGKKDLFELRGYIITNEQMFKADYNVLLKNLFECFYKSNGDLTKRRIILLTIADAMEADSYVLDHEINFFATCIKIGNIIL